MDQSTAGDIFFVFSLSHTSNTAVSFTKTKVKDCKCVYLIDILKSLKEKQCWSQPLVLQHTHSHSNSDSDKREHLANTKHR